MGAYFFGNNFNNAVLAQKNAPVLTTCPLTDKQKIVNKQLWKERVIIMLKNPFKQLKKQDYILWLSSLFVVTVSSLFSGSSSPITILATIIGVTALIFTGGGDVWGQILIIFFSILYAINAYVFRYYGEMITYLGMTLPISIISTISWLKHPYSSEKNEVKIHKLNKSEIIIMILLSIIVTFAFYFILKALNTANLIFSTISITTSFLAAYLSMRRNSWYAIAYAANDIVLIVLWVSASLKDMSYFPMVVCFAVFLINDFYGFSKWKKREKRQQAKIFD